MRNLQTEHHYRAGMAATMCASSTNNTHLSWRHLSASKCILGAVSKCILGAIMLGRGQEGALNAVRARCSMCIMWSCYYHVHVYAHRISWQTP